MPPDYKTLLAMYGDDVGIASYSLYRAKKRAKERRNRKPEDCVFGKPGSGYAAMKALTKQAMDEALLAAQKAYEMSRYVRRGARLGVMATPVVHEDDIEDLRVKFRDFKKATKQNPELLKELKK